MRSFVLSLLTLVSLPASAAELQFNLSGLALASGDSGTPNIPFAVIFELNTLGGTTSSFSFSFPPQCLTGWSFTGSTSGPVNAAIVSVTVGGKTVLPPGLANAFGDGGDLFEHCTLEAGAMTVGPIFWDEIVTQNTAPLKLNPQDPLGDLFLHSLCHGEGETFQVGCNVGFITIGASGEGWNLDVNSVKITAVWEPGFLGLMLLGVTEIALRTRQVWAPAEAD